MVKIKTIRLVMTVSGLISEDSQLLETELYLEMVSRVIEMYLNNITCPWYRFISSSVHLNSKLVGNIGGEIDYKLSIEISRFMKPSHFLKFVFFFPLCGMKFLCKAKPSNFNHLFGVMTSEYLKTKKESRND